MDALYFKTNSKASVLSELGLHEDPEKQDGKFFNGHLYQGDDFIFAWIGQIPDEWETVVDTETEESYERPSKYKDGLFFNIWVDGQKAMDKAYSLVSAERIEPVTPNMTLF